MLDAIRDGSLERLLLVIIVFGGIVLLLVMNGTVDDRLVDFAFVILGYFFRTNIDKIVLATNGSTKVLS